MNSTEISWTDLSWNPVTGCDKVSPGCKHCYAEKRANNRFYRKAFPNGFKVTLHPERLDQVRKLKAGSKVFVNSMSDLFHEGIPFDYIDRVIEAVRSRPDVIFQVLTKRPERASRYWGSTVDKEEVGFPPNLWLGVSVELQAFTHRISTLLFDIPAAVKFVSFEPLLGPMGEVRLYASRSPGYWRGIDWIIIGGESGKGHRPMKTEWAVELVRQAKEQDIAVFMKQLGGPRSGGNLEDFPPELRVREFPGGKE